MKRTLIRYKTKPDMADRNAELIAGVFAELKATRPDGVRYLSLRLDDDSFIHLVETEADDGASAIPGLAAFKAFQSGIRERCLEPPAGSAASRSSAIIGCWLNNSPRISSFGKIAAMKLFRIHRPPPPAYRRPAGRDAAEAASLLRAHGRLGDRRRGRAAGCADQGGGVVRVGRPDRQSGRLAVSDRAQHRAGFSAPPQPAASDPVRRGGGHDCRPGRHRRQPPVGRRQSSHLHAASGRPALQRDPDGCARLLAKRSLRGDGFQPARGESSAASRTQSASRNGRRTGRSAASGTIEGRSRSSWRLCRPLQRAGFRRHPRHDCRRRPARSGQQTEDERQASRFPSYFGNYSKAGDWHLVPGLVEGRPAILVFDPGNRPRAKIFHAAANGLPTRSPTIRDFPPRLYHRWRPIPGPDRA